MWKYWGILGCENWLVIGIVLYGGWYSCWKCGEIQLIALRKRTVGHVYVCIICVNPWKVKLCCPLVLPDFPLKHQQALH